MSAPDIRAYLEIRTAAPAGWSPDGSKLLISSNLPGTSQLYRLGYPPDGTPLRQLTATAEPVGGAYLPVGDDVLVVSDDGGNERYQLYTMPDDPSAPVTDPDGLTPLVVDPDHIHRPGGTSRDGRLLAYATNRRNGVDFDVVVRDLGDASEQVVWDDGGWCAGAGFSPDGRVLAVSCLTQRPGDNRVWLVDRPTGGRVELAPHPDQEASVGGPSWLPDSSGGFFSTSVGREFSGVARFDAGSGRWEHVLTPDGDTGCALDWTGTHLLVVTNADGLTTAELRDPTSLALRTEVPLPGPGVASGWTFSRDGRRLAYAFSSATVPGDTFVVDLEDLSLTRATTSPCDVDLDAMVDPELVRVTSFDGLEIPLFVFRPRGAATDRRRPVVVMIHGGPESQYRPSFSPLTQYLVARGFVVVAPNVRGSTGYGRTYEHLDDVDRRLDAVRDLEAIHDWVAASDDLDPDRVALYGGSYGGYMVLAGLALQPERWAAGVDVVGISSLVTFLENTSSWRRAFREREYGSLEHDRDLLVEASPITHVDRMRAPLFIIHGANDPRVPLSEAEQIHRVLRAKGVRCDLEVYADEGHGLAKLANRVDAYPKVATFLEQVLGH